MASEYETMNELEDLVRTAEADFAHAATPADLENAKARYLGKAGLLTDLLKGMALNRLGKWDEALKFIEAYRDLLGEDVPLCAPMHAPVLKSAMT